MCKFCLRGYLPRIVALSLRILLLLSPIWPAHVSGSFHCFSKFEVKMQALPCIPHIQFLTFASSAECTWGFPRVITYFLLNRLLWVGIWLIASWITGSK